VTATNKILYVHAPAAYALIILSYIPLLLADFILHDNDIWWWSSRQNSSEVRVKDKLTVSDRHAGGCMDAICSKVIQSDATCG